MNGRNLEDVARLRTIRECACVCKKSNIHGHAVNELFLQEIRMFMDNAVNVHFLQDIAHSWPSREWHSFFKKSNIHRHAVNGSYSSRKLDVHGHAVNGQRLQEKAH